MRFDLPCYNSRYFIVEVWCCDEEKFVQREKEGNEDEETICLFGFSASVADSHVVVFLSL